MILCKNKYLNSKACYDSLYIFLPLASPQGKNERQRAGSASPEGQCVPATP